MTHQYQIHHSDGITTADAEYCARMAAPFDWTAWNADMDKRRLATLASLEALDIAEAECAASAIAVSRSIRDAIEGVGL